MPKITIITVCFNAEKYIEQTIQSVIKQKECDIEYIIVDGASTDKTGQIIQQYNSHITRWISEPDKGIADAMNKGVALATGEYILFLHADDYLFTDDAVQSAAELMDSSTDIHAFGVLYDTNGKKIKKSSKPFGFRTYFKTPVMHQGAFCKKELFEKTKGFDTSYKIAMDYAFFFEAFRCKAKINIHNYVLSVMRDTGISSRQDWLSVEQRLLEEKRVHNSCNHSLFVKGIYKIYWLFYMPYKKYRLSESNK